MTSPAPNPTLEAGGLYPIRTVADLTGVNAITLRAWERRYGLLEPIRKDSGHRLYTQEHIDLINRVVGLLDRGMRIGQVKDHLDAQEADGAGGDIWRRYLNHMIAAVIRFDESALDDTYGEVLAHYPVEAMTDRLLNPLLKEIGRRWQDGEGSVAEEHFFAFYLRNKLGARFHHRARRGKGPALLLACLPGERHETGLLLFALAANDRGYRALLLGADMPLDGLPVAARKTGCDAVVLSGVMAPQPHLLEKDLPRLVLEAGVPVFVGGKVSVEGADAIHRAQAEPLGNDVAAGLDRLDEILPGNDDV